MTGHFRRDARQASRLCLCANTERHMCGYTYIRKLVSAQSHNGVQALAWTVRLIGEGDAFRRTTGSVSRRATGCNVAQARVPSARASADDPRFENRRRACGPVEQIPFEVMDVDRHSPRPGRWGDTRQLPDADRDEATYGAFATDLIAQKKCRTEAHANGKIGCQRLVHFRAFGIENTLIYRLAGYALRRSWAGRCQLA